MSAKPDQTQAKWRHKMLKMTVSLALLTLLVGCQSDRLIPLTKQGSEPLVCSQWLSIYYDHLKDRPRTVDQIRRNNSARGAYCAK